MLKHLDLFSGIGGFSLAARRCGSGIQTIQFVEINPDAQSVLRSQFPGVPIHSGTRTGLKHPASSLWREGLRCLMLVRPKFCIIEQPEGIIRRGAKTYDQYWFKYEECENGNRKGKSRYIPKSSLAKVTRMNNEKMSPKRILDFLNSKSRRKKS